MFKLNSKPKRIIFVMILTLLVSAFSLWILNIYAQTKNISKDASFAANTYEINTASDWNAFAESVMSGNTYAGWTVNLNHSLTWQRNPRGLYTGPLTNINQEGNAPVFAGTFDGHGHYISSTKPYAGARYNNYTYNSFTNASCGFFPVLANGAVIKNFELSGYTITLYNHDPIDYSMNTVLAFGGICGLAVGDVRFENCYVTSFKITGTPPTGFNVSSGAFVGRQLHGQTTIVNSCVNKLYFNSTSSASSFNNMYAGCIGQIVNDASLSVTRLVYNSGNNTYEGNYTRETYANDMSSGSVTNNNCIYSANTTNDISSVLNANGYSWGHLCNKNVGPLWFYNKNFNDGYPILRMFLTLQSYAVNFYVDNELDTASSNKLSVSDGSNSYDITPNDYLLYVYYDTATSEIPNTFNGNSFEFQYQTITALATSGYVFDKIERGDNNISVYFYTPVNIKFYATNQNSPSNSYQYKINTNYDMPAVTPPSADYEFVGWTNNVNSFSNLWDSGSQTATADKDWYAVWRYKFYNEMNYLDNNTLTEVAKINVNFYGYNNTETSSNSKYKIENKKQYGYALCVCNKDYITNQSSITNFSLESYSPQQYKYKSTDNTTWRDDFNLTCSINPYKSLSAVTKDAKTYNFAGWADSSNSTTASWTSGNKDIKLTDCTQSGNTYTKNYYAVWKYVDPEWVDPNNHLTHTFYNGRNGTNPTEVPTNIYYDGRIVYYNYTLTTGTPSTAQGELGTPKFYDLPYQTTTVNENAYTFAGWNNPTTASWTSGAKQVTANTTWYSVWTPNEYKVTYISNGGSISGRTLYNENNTIYEKYTIESATFDLLIPTKEWYTLDHYKITNISTTYETDSGTSVKKSANENYSINAEISENGGNSSIYQGSYGDITVEAVWKPKTYTLNFSKITVGSESVNPTQSSVPINSFTDIKFYADFKNNGNDPSNMYYFVFTVYKEQAAFIKQSQNTEDIEGIYTVTYTLGNSYTEDEDMWKYTITGVELSSNNITSTFTLETVEPYKDTYTASLVETVNNYNVILTVGLKQYNIGVNQQ